DAAARGTVGPEAAGMKRFAVQRVGDRFAASRQIGGGARGAVRGGCEACFASGRPRLQSRRERDDAAGGVAVQRRKRPSQDLDPFGGIERKVGNLSLTVRQG